MKTIHHQKKLIKQNETKHKGTWNHVLVFGIFFLFKTMVEFYFGGLVKLGLMF